MIDVDYNSYKETIAENMELIQKNHKLQEKIDKAVEHLKKYNEVEKTFYYKGITNVDMALEILKGE